MNDEEISEHCEFINHLFIQTKKEIVKINTALQQMEKKFAKNPKDEFVLEDLQEIFETLQGLNCFLTTQHD
jgi:hypothetical protein